MDHLFSAFCRKCLDVNYAYERLSLVLCLCHRFGSATVCLSSAHNSVVTAHKHTHAHAQTQTPATMKINYKMIIKHTEWIWGELVAKLVFIILGSSSCRPVPSCSITRLFVICLESPPMIFLSLCIRLAFVRIIFNFFIFFSHRNRLNLPMQCSLPLLAR